MDLKDRIVAMAGGSQGMGRAMTIGVSDADFDCIEVLVI
jgi:hypothetical protein